MAEKRCRAKNPSQCVDSACPEKRGAESGLANAVLAEDFTAFVVAKQKSAGSTSASIKSYVKEKYPTVSFHLNEHNSSYMILDLISVPKNLRGQGVAKDIMSSLTVAADENSWTLVLTPSNDFGASLIRLEAFYRRYGFVLNSGHNKNPVTAETMIRFHR